MNSPVTQHNGSMNQCIFKLAATSSRAIHGFCEG